jgi:mannose-6-phosphate isomerase-like protein (cupin superfamily)
MRQRRFVARAGGGWAGVEREGYAPGAPSRVMRHTLVGQRKARPDDPGPALEVRYFQVPPEGATRLERHEHEHFVIVGEGRGHALVGDEVREIGVHDVVYVAPGEAHQFVNRGSETFGFFCIVGAHRDIAQRLEDGELADLLASPAGAFIDPGAQPVRTPR